MTLSQGLLQHLRSDTSDEPLPKRLKLAENVLLSPELPIVHKENCILKWLCNEISIENANTIWITIHHCLSLNPKTFSKLFPETKSLLIGKLRETLIQYPQSYISEDIIKCCQYIFSNSQINCSSKENSVILLIKALLEFTLKVLDFDNFEKENFGYSIIVECAEQAIGTFIQVCRHSLSGKKNFTSVFIKELFFPLALLNKKLKSKNIPSKIAIEIEKCVKRLLLPFIKNINSINTDENDKNMKETEYIFNTIKDTVAVKQFEEVETAFTFLFQWSINAFSQNSVLIYRILHRLVNCVNQKHQARQILISLLENSVDVTFSFEHEIEGVTLKTYLKTQIEEILSKNKHLKCSDYNLVAVIAKLNPLVIEDMTQSILKKIVFENKKHKKEEIEYGKCFTELWTASVRLRRQHKFLSKFLITVANFKEEKDSSFIDKFDLPETFILKFKEDVKAKNTNAQMIAMFHTLNFHLQSDCYKVLKESGPRIKKIKKNRKNDNRIYKLSTVFE
ncbi:uncharacterized protein LOC131668952 [Phymastichus coffea]|uniref:uncharacterized protein LOC131668952 n=1 Tax=Phymastichus coffea TaxID=108790 RepID=UPI00273C033C|nr:uncharacterized protein LOC131668952 [Phymastichus coffea]